MGIEQTEIDALATLQPDLLRAAAEEALGEFYDATLDGRVEAARQEWLTAAIEVVNDQQDSAELDRIHREAETKLAEMREQIEQLNEALRVDLGDYELPGIEVPEPDLPPESALAPLVDSRWDFADQCRALIASKAYRDGDGS